MIIFKIPQNLKAIIFDIDSTLYTCPSYAFEQVDCQIREYAKENGMSVEKAREKVSEYRKEFSKNHNGSKVSLGNTLLAFGVPIEKSVEWRKKLLEPKDFLSYDGKLVEELKILKKSFKMICVTNNPVLPARKTLEAIGISEFFPDIVGLDTCFKSKPAKGPFLKALEILDCQNSECLCIGDRYDMDIALPLSMGMGGILVNGVCDVYELDKIVL